MLKSGLSSEIKSFEEFWPQYLGEHRRASCRFVHYVAGTTALGLVAWGIASGQWILLAIAPLSTYGLAWIAHFFLEKNVPATWVHPVWSVRAEYKMLAQAITGRLRAEYARVLGEADWDSDDGQPRDEP